MTLVIAALAALGAWHCWTWFTGGHAETPAAVPSPVAAAEPVQPDIARARELMDQGKTAEAGAMLEALLKGAPDANVAPQALIMLAQARQQEGNLDGAAQAAERAYREFASSPHHPEAAVAYARILEATGKAEEAAKIFEEVRSSAPPDMRAPAITAAGRQAEQAQDLVKARDLYRQAVNEAPWDSDAWNEAVEALGRANIALIFSPGQTPESKTYTVQKGDSITSIGNALNTTQGLLMRANSIDETTRLNLGQQLKYTPKDFRIVIERSRCRLFLVDKDGIFKLYKTGLGKPGHETTLGSYKIGNKEKNPIWHKPGAGPIPAGDPGNELGTRWMPLVPDQAGLPKDLGIHGTIRPETVGLYSSNGCARLLPAEIEELYDLVVRSTPVDIVETCTPEDLKRGADVPAASAQEKTH